MFQKNEIILIVFKLNHIMVNNSMCHLSLKSINSPSTRVQDNCRHTASHFLTKMSAIDQDMTENLKITEQKLNIQK